MPAACWSSAPEWRHPNPRLNRPPSHRRPCLGSVQVWWNPSAVEPFSNRPDRRPRGPVSPRASDPLDQRLDRWMSAGRQLVDGVSGARPGGRAGARPQDSSGDGRPGARPSLEGLGRWVEDRLDWLLEDEDDWREPWQQERSSSRDGRGSNRDLRPPSREESAPRSAAVRPVELSGRPDALAKERVVDRELPEPQPTTKPRRALEAMSRREPRQRDAGLDDWPEAEDFQVSRWQRSSESPLPQRPATGPARPSSGQTSLAQDRAVEEAPQNRAEPGRGVARPLPRSSRRRD